MIELQNVSKWYGSFQVLTDCTTSINKGEVVVICGPSGSGKSTLIKTINALEPFQKGAITVDGINLHDPKTKIIVFSINIKIFMVSNCKLNVLGLMCVSMVTSVW